MIVINSPKDVSPTNVIKFNIIIRNSAFNVCAALMNHILHRHYFFSSLMPDFSFSLNLSGNSIFVIIFIDNFMYLFPPIHHVTVVPLKHYYIIDMLAAFSIY